MTKRILCLALAAVLAFFFFSCSKKEKVPSTMTFKKGSPSAHGDKFDAPKIEQSTNGPIIAELSKQALPDDSITLAGQGFSDSSLKAYVYALDKDGKAQTKETKYTVIDDQTMSVLIDESLRFGVYGVYLENSEGTSAMKYVNRPKIWNVGMTKLAAGDTFNIYGENLTTDLGDKVRIYLINNNKYCQVEPVYADPYKISFRVPLGLKDGAEYEVKIHTGHGGNLGFATAPQKLLFSSKDPDAFSGETIDITDFGIDPTTTDKSLDASPIIQEAIDSANDGDIIYLPAGVYYCDSNIEVSKSVKIMGSKKGDTVLVTSNEMENYLFMVDIGHVEFTNINFRRVCESDTIKSGFISYCGDQTDTDFFNLYIHDCDFLQTVLPEYKSKYPCIYFTDAANIIIDDNTFDATSTVCGYYSSKVAVTNNNAKMSLYAGTYYSQDSSFYTGVSDLDISRNTYIGRDYEIDSSGRLDKDDMTVGRWVVIQGTCSNHYISNNTVKAGGIPGFGAGEQLLYENVQPKYEGAITAADDSTLTLAQSSGYIVNSGDIVTIIDGTGFGQYALVSYASKNLVHLDTAFTITPDSTSTVIISSNFHNSAVYKNFFNGHTNYPEGKASSGTCAVSVYGGMHNMFFMNNYGEHLAQGICIVPFVDATRNQKSVVFWSQFDGNEFFDTSTGCRIYPGVFSEDHAVSSHGKYTVGITARRNSFDTTKSYINYPEYGGDTFLISIHFRNLTSTPFIYGILLEHNTFKNSDKNDVITYKSSAGVILRNNKNIDEGSDGILKIDNTLGGKLIYTDY